MMMSQEKVSILLYPERLHRLHRYEAPTKEQCLPKARELVATDPHFQNLKCNESTDSEKKYALCEKWDLGIRRLEFDLKIDPCHKDTLEAFTELGTKICTYEQAVYGPDRMTTFVQLADNMIESKWFRRKELEVLCAYRLKASECVLDGALNDLQAMLGEEECTKDKSQQIDTLILDLQDDAEEQCSQRHYVRFAEMMRTAKPGRFNEESEEYWHESREEMESWFQDCKQVAEMLLRGERGEKVHEDLD